VTHGRQEKLTARSDVQARSGDPLLPLENRSLHIRVRKGVQVTLPNGIDDNIAHLFRVDPANTRAEFRFLQVYVGESSVAQVAGTITLTPADDYDRILATIASATCRT
jgi:hypothetical protein